MAIAMKVVMVMAMAMEMASRCHECDLHQINER